MTGHESDLKLAMRTKRLLCLYRDWTDCTSLEDPSQGILKNTVKCLLQVHITPVHWLGKFPCSLQALEGLELVQCSTTRMEPTQFLLNLKLDNWSHSFLQHPCIDLTREAEECDSPETGKHPLVP